MPGKVRELTVAKLASLRPFLYHLTAAANLARIRETQTLRSATQILSAAGRTDLLSKRRPDHVAVDVDGTTILVRDQAPLFEGNTALGDGMTFDQFVSLLNSQVFFWPGNAEKPIPYGVRHFERYGSEESAILRVPFLELCGANEDRTVRVCRYNSGSPRCTGGRRSPRSADTFVALPASDMRAGDVVEVVFTPDVRLPSSVEVADRLNGSWTRLW